MFLRKTNDDYLSIFMSSGVLDESMCEHALQWVPPVGWFISVETIGTTFIILFIIRKKLLLIISISSELLSRRSFFCLSFLSYTELDGELSCIEIPEKTKFQSESSFSLPRLSPMKKTRNLLP